MPFPVDEKYILITEEKLGIIFPDRFRKRMMQENGGDITILSDRFRLHPFFDTSNKKRIRRTCNDIVSETINAREWTGYPQNAISISSNDSGDHVIFMVEEFSNILLDAIYFWDHETHKVDKITVDFDRFFAA